MFKIDNKIFQISWSITLRNSKVLYLQIFAAGEISYKGNLPLDDMQNYFQM